jgi:hypothetical protein
MATTQSGIDTRLGHAPKHFSDAVAGRVGSQNEVDTLGLPVHCAGVFGKRRVCGCRCAKLPLALRMAAWFLGALAAILFCCGIAATQSGRPEEYEVKAAFLINFAKFVEWPDSSFDSPQAPFVFGVIGGDHQLAFNLRHLSAGEKVQGRNIVIRERRFGDDVRHCHILFVSASEYQHTAQILASLQDASVLTVSDIDGFADAGGAMQFVMQENRVRFIVNLRAATQSKLRMSAKLLALAHVINHNEAAR